MDISNDDDAIRALLRTAKRIAVVGASPKPDRDSHRIARYLIEAGYEVIPVNPGQTEILGRRCYPDLASIPGKVDLVDVFRSPEHVPGVVEDALAAGAGALWLQLGAGHDGAVRRAAEAGMDVVSEQCIMVVHKVLGVAQA